MRQTVVRYYISRTHTHTHTLTHTQRHVSTKGYQKSRPIDARTLTHTQTHTLFARGEISHCSCVKCRTKPLTYVYVYVHRSVSSSKRTCDFYVGASLESTIFVSKMVLRCKVKRSLLVMFLGMDVEIFLHV